MSFTKWRVQSSSQGEIDQTDFDSEQEAIEYIKHLREAHSEAPISLINPEGQSEAATSHSMVNK